MAVGQNNSTLMDIIKTIEWTPETYTVRELLQRQHGPIIAMVVQGHCSLEEDDSLSQGQIIRIARMHVQNRVIARDAKDREISIPFDFPLQFEILPNKSGSIRGTFRKLKRMKLNDLVRNYQLPHKVRLPVTQRNDPILLDLIGIDLVSGPVDLLKVEDEVYLQGNAVNFGELDKTVLNIPEHSDLEVCIALGVTTGKQSQFTKLENKLADRVAKEVRFGEASGAKAIKRLVQIGTDADPYRPPTVRNATALDSAASNGKYAQRNRYNKRDTKGSSGGAKRRAIANGPRATNGMGAFNYENAAYNGDDYSDSDELESEANSSEVIVPGGWTDIALDDEDLGENTGPPKELFNAVSDFSFHNKNRWGF